MSALVVVAVVAGVTGTVVADEVILSETRWGTLCLFLLIVQW